MVSAHFHRDAGVDRRVGDRLPEGSGKFEKTETRVRRLSVHASNNQGAPGEVFVNLIFRSSRVPIGTPRNRIVLYRRVTFF